SRPQPAQQAEEGRGGELRDVVALVGPRHQMSSPPIRRRGRESPAPSRGIATTHRTTWDESAVWTEVVAGDFDDEGGDDIAGHSQAGNWLVAVSQDDDRFENQFWGYDPVVYEVLFPGQFDEERD
ncbi:MAG TPA: hypothetical protein VF170_04825, partial [Planctomycetaceae bacterium]